MHIFKPLLVLAAFAISACCSARSAVDAKNTPRSSSDITSVTSIRNADLSSGDKNYAALQRWLSSVVARNALPRFVDDQLPTHVHVEIRHSAISSNNDAATGVASTHRSPNGNGLFDPDPPLPPTTGYSPGDQISVSGCRNGGMASWSAKLVKDPDGSSHWQITSFSWAHSNQCGLGN